MPTAARSLLPLVALLAAMATAPAQQVAAPVALRPTDVRLHLVAGTFDPLAVVPASSGVLAAPRATRLWLVQFAVPITPAALAFLAGFAPRGLEVLHHVPAQAMLVRGDAATIALLRTEPRVRWCGPLVNGWKLAPELHAFVAAARTGNGADAAPAVLELNLAFAHKRDAAAVAARVVAVGGAVTGEAPGSTFLRARLTATQLLAVLDGDGVVFVDAAQPIGFDMDNARAVGGANQIEVLGGFTGQGVRVEITEPLEETHPELQGRVLVRGTNNVDSHGHCTAGIVGADGSANAQARGMLPAGTLIEGGYTAFGSLLHFAQATGSTDPSQPWQAMVATASWGTGLTSLYTTATQALDDALFTADLPRTQSMGNNGNNAQVRAEAWAKNGISVGGVCHYDDALPGNDTWLPGPTAPQVAPASIGPALDGRIKPELVAFYDGVFTLDRVGSAGFTVADYNPSFRGTSAATPIVAGHLGLALQLYTDGLFGNPLPQPALPQHRFANRPHMATAKALLCNTASQYAFSGSAHDLTRTHQGFGFPSLQRLYAERDRLLVCDQYDRLQFAQTRSYYVFVAPGTPELRVTMAFPDPAALPLASIARINDLDLRVVRWSDGLSWWGNHGLDVGTASTPGGAADDRNTMESVYLDQPQAGLYRIDVTAAQVVADGDLTTPQLDVPFALVAHPLGGGSRVTTGVQLQATCAAGGQLAFAASGVPATGWDEGFTAVTFATDRGLGFGNLFGLEFDALGAALTMTTMAPGNAFHFPNAAGTYPFAAYTFPLPGLVALFAGQQLDAVVVLLDQGLPVAVSNVARVSLQ
ncbi:MAG: S8 family serine peptidase [Planctomycetota bacterium]|jgi:serine protease AprX